MTHCFRRALLGLCLVSLEALAAPLGSPLPDLATETAAAAPEAAVAGRYLVIGSFGSRANAERWAERNAEFEPAVVRFGAAGQSRWRVVIGPVAATDLNMMRDVLQAAGIATIWPVTLCGARRPDCAPPPVARGNEIAEVWPRRAP